MAIFGIASPYSFSMIGMMTSASAEEAVSRVEHAQTLLADSLPQSWAGAAAKGASARRLDLFSQLQELKVVLMHARDLLTRLEALESQGLGGAA